MSDPTSTPTDGEQELRPKNFIVLTLNVVPLLESCTSRRIAQSPNFPFVSDDGEPDFA